MNFYQFNAYHWDTRADLVWEHGRFLAIRTEKGRVHLLGNWQFPLLKTFPFHLFWNAASFGEMEPDIVQNYLSYIQDSCRYIYLLQARNGKESTKSSWAMTPIRFSDYEAMLSGFSLLEVSDAFDVHRKMSQRGGYFQAVWQKA